MLSYGLPCSVVKEQFLELEVQDSGGALASPSLELVSGGEASRPPRGATSDAPAARGRRILVSWWR